MDITSFDDLLVAARRQPEPQRLLFVLTRAERPEHATPAQLAAFEAGEGGALAPAAAVDRDPAELDRYATLAAEADQVCPGWVLAFAAGLSGLQGRPPSDAEAGAALERMVEDVRRGHLGHLLAFDRQGRPVRLG